MDLGSPLEEGLELLDGGRVAEELLLQDSEGATLGREGEREEGRNNEDVWMERTRTEWSAPDTIPGS